MSPCFLFHDSIIRFYYVFIAAFCVYCISFQRSYLSPYLSPAYLPGPAYLPMSQPEFRMHSCLFCVWLELMHSWGFSLREGVFCVSSRVYACCLILVVCIYLYVCMSPDCVSILPVSRLCTNISPALCIKMSCLPLCLLWMRMPVLCAPCQDVLVHWLQACYMPAFSAFPLGYLHALFPACLPACLPIFCPPDRPPACLSMCLPACQRKWRYVF